MTYLDLTTPLDVVTAPRRARTKSDVCVVELAARPDCCGRDDWHAADVYITLSCGCSYTYCRRALVVIYGRTKLTHALCPRHENAAFAIVVADVFA